MQRNFNGSSLAQYAIVLALVAVAVVPVFMIYGKEIVSILQGYTSIFTDMNNQMATNKGSNPSEEPSEDPPGNPPPSQEKVGPLGGTPSAPVTDCSTPDSCTIDYGSFVLSGIPENFPIAVETMGGAGGIETMAQLMDILATAQENGDIQMDGGSLRDLANLGHELARQESIYENDMTSMIATGESKIDFGFQCALNDGLAIVHTDFNNALGSLQISPNDPNAANVQNIINILSGQINSLYDNLYPQLTLMADNGIGYVPSLAEMEAILHPQASLVTDVDSQIICQTGAGQDAGHQCN